MNFISLERAKKLNLPETRMPKLASCEECNGLGTVVADEFDSDSKNYQATRLETCQCQFKN